MRFKLALLGLHAAIAILPPAAAGQVVTRHLGRSGPSIHPGGGTDPVVHPAYSTSETFTFWVINPDPVSASFNVVCDAGPPLELISCPSSVGVPALDSAAVEARFATGAPGSGKLTIDIWGFAGNARGYITVRSGLGAVAVDPDTTVVIQPGGFYGLAFRIHNDLDTAYTFPLTASCGGAIGAGCSPPIPAMTLSPRADTVITMYVTAGPVVNPEGGWATLVAWVGAGAWADSATYSLEPQRPGLAVDHPAVIDADTARTASITFTVLNTGNVDLTVTLDPGCSGAAAASSCQVAGAPERTVAPGASSLVTVEFVTTPVPGDGTVRLSVFSDDTSAVADAEVRVGGVNPVAEVIPPSGTVVVAPHQPAAITMQVRNLRYDPVGVTYRPRCSGAAIVLPCTVAPSGSPGLDTAGIAVQVHFTAGPERAPGTIVLEVATGESVIGNGVATVEVGGTTTISVSPKDSTLEVSPNSATQTRFIVRNGGAVAIPLHLYCVATVPATNGCAPSPSGLTLAGGDTASVAVGYTPAASGAGRLTLVATLDGAPVDSGWYQVSIASTPSVTLHPAVGGITLVPDSLGSFPVVVTAGPLAAVVTLKASCSGTWFTTCRVAPDSFQLPPGSSVVTSASVLSTAPDPAGRMVITAEVTGGTGDTVSVLVDVLGPASARVVPDGDTVTVLSTATLEVTYSVTNTSSDPLAIRATTRCSGDALTVCPVVDTVLTQVNPGASRLVTVRGPAGAAGASGSLVLVASTTTGILLDTGYVVIRVPSGLVVDLAPPDPMVVPAGATATGTFRLTHRGTQAGTVLLTPTCAGVGLSPTCTATPTQMALSPGQVDSATVHFTATGPSGPAGYVGLEVRAATDSMLLSTGSTLVTVGGVAVIPDGQVVPVYGQSPGLQSFTVTNQTTATTTVTLEVSCNGGGVQPGCTIDLPTVTLPAASSAFPKVSYTTGIPGDTGTIVVRARVAAAIVDSGTVILTVIVPVPSARVWPDSLPLGLVPASTLTRPFQVVNTGNTPYTFALRPVCTGPGVAADCVVDRPSVSLGAPDSTTVYVTFATRSGGDSGTVTLEARADTTVLDRGSLLVSVLPDPGVTVSPKGLLVEVVGGSPAAADFEVRQSGATDLLLTYTPACTGLAAGGQCYAEPAEAWLPAGGIDTVRVWYQTGFADAVGKVVLRALAGETMVDTGYVRVQLPAVPGTPLLRLDRVNLGSARPRDACVSIVLGDGAAAECGELRLMHALPGFRTFSAWRVPTLAYLSGTSVGHPVVAAEVTIPAGSALPPSVTVILSRGGLERARGTWPGAEWVPGSARVVRLVDTTGPPPATGLLPYVVEVRADYVAGSTSSSIR